MPESILQLKIFPHDGAENSTKHPLLISPKDIVSSNNIAYSTYSTKIKRPGIKRQFSSNLPNNLIGLNGFDFWRLGTQRTVIYNGKRLFAYRSDGTFDDITGTFSLPVNEVVSFTAYQGLLIICFGDGATPPKAWTQTGAIFDLHSTAPNAPFCRIWLNRLWMPDPTVPGRLLYSQTGNVQFTGGDSGAIDLDPNDDNPDGITAIFPPYFGDLYVAKRFCIYRISPVILSNGTQVFSSLKIIDGVGCNSHNAAIAVESDIIFTDDRGVHKLSSTNKLSAVDTSFLSADIQPDWVNGVNFNRARYMTACYDRTLNSYILTYPGISRLYPNSVWGYSIAVDKWYQWNNYNHPCVFRYLEPLSKRVRTMVCSDNGDIGIIDESKTLDYSKPISLRFQSGLITPGGAPQDQFSFQFITAIFTPQATGTFTITYKIDGRTIETLTFDMEDTSLGDELGIDFITGVSVLGGIPKVKLFKRRMKGYGMISEFFIEHIAQSTENNDEKFEFLGLILDVDRVSQVIGTSVA